MDIPTTEPLKPAPLDKCAHEGCICTVEPGTQFCSDSCLEAAGTEHGSPTHECECGHAECVQAPRLAPVGAMGTELH